MKTYLKESTVQVDGESLAIVELSAGARRDLMAASKQHAGDHLYFAAITVKRGCAEYAGETPEAILDSMTHERLGAIASAILELSGMKPDAAEGAEKN